MEEKLVKPEPEIAKAQVNHTIDHAKQAEEPRVVVSEDANVVAPMEALVFEPIVDTPAKKPKGKRKPKAKPELKSPEITSEAAPAVKVIDGPTRLSAPSASDLHPLGFASAPKLETITAPIASPVVDPAIDSSESARLIKSTEEKSVEATSIVAKDPSATKESPTLAQTLDILAPVQEETQSPAEAPLQTIAQDLPAPKDDIKTVTPMTHPNPVNSVPIINGVTIVLGAAAAVGIIYAYLHGFDIITVFIKH